MRDVLSHVEMLRCLSPARRDTDVFVHDVIDSTSSEARRLALAGAASEAIVLANQQTAGRGRRGRSFYSPVDTGLYMSVLLRPADDMGDMQRVTLYAAVCVCRALEELAGVRPRIKWVNDVFLWGRKVCGILTETVTDAESGAITGVVVGIGVNIRTADFPQALRGIAGGVLGGGAAPALTRCALAARVAEPLLAVSGRAMPDFMPAYRARCLVLGREVTFTRGGGVFQGRVETVDDAGRLIVALPDGRREALSSGEVSLGSGTFAEAGNA